MSDRESILASLRRAFPDLKRQYLIQSLGLFGSVARGDARDTSDVDILVEFAGPVSLSTFLTLEAELGQLIGRQVDLVSRRALKPYTGRNVARDLVAV
jgi:uncharacterized protein